MVGTAAPHRNPLRAFSNQLFRADMAHINATRLFFNTDTPDDHKLSLESNIRILFSRFGPESIDNAIYNIRFYGL